MSNADIAVALNPQSPNEPAEQPIPANAVMPREWFVFSMWMPSIEDAGKSFEQVIEIYWPNSDKFTEGRLPFKADEKASYNSIQMLGFPIGQVGNIKIQTWLEYQGSRITDTFDYCVSIKHLDRPPSPVTASQTN